MYLLAHYWSSASDFLRPTKQGQKDVRELYDCANNLHYSQTNNHNSIVLTCIERIPGILIIYSQSNPLCDNFLFTLIHGTSRMFGKAIVHFFGNRINITKKDSTSLDWLDMNTSIPKVGTSSLCRKCTIHDHGGHASTKLVWHSIAIAIAMWS